MEENQSGSKPLRNTTDKMKDLYNTYVKGDGKSRDIKINTSEDVEEEKGKEMEKDKTEELKEEATQEQSEEQVEVNEGTESDIDDRDERIAKLEKELADKSDHLRRLSAEFDNFRKRTLKEKRDLTEYANENVFRNFIDIKDDLDNAIKASNEKSDFESLKKGVDMIGAKFARSLENDGVKKMEDPTGKPFDYEYHEAIMQIPSEVDADHVVQEVQPGYMYKEKVLRHAKVVTSAGMPEASKEEDDGNENNNGE